MNIIYHELIKRDLRAALTFANEEGLPGWGCGSRRKGKFLTRPEPERIGLDGPPQLRITAGSSGMGDPALTEGDGRDRFSP